jgi:hypothetical protein
LIKPLNRFIIIFIEKRETVLENTAEAKIEIKNKAGRLCFIGVALGESGSAETGIAILDKNLNLLRVDKAYNLSDLKSNFAHIAPPQSVIACVSMPRNVMMLNGKWRIESKNTKSLKLGNFETEKYAWTQRFSDRGSELCRNFIEEGMEVFRYNCYHTQTSLQITPPYRSRTPAACKYLQMVLENKLKISGMPTNLIPLPAMNAIIGAYIAWKTVVGEEDTDFQQIGVHKNIPVITAISV